MLQCKLFKKLEITLLLQYRKVLTMKHFSLHIFAKYSTSFLKSTLTGLLIFQSENCQQITLNFLNDSCLDKIKTSQQLNGSDNSICYDDTLEQNMNDTLKILCLRTSAE